MSDVRDTTMSVVLGGKSLLVYDINDPDKPIELAFQSRYGALVAYRWFGDGYIVLGFDSGHMVVMSTHMQVRHRHVTAARKPSRHRHVTTVYLPCNHLLTSL